MEDGDAAAARRAGRRRAVVAAAVFVVAVALGLGAYRAARAVAPLAPGSPREVMVVVHPGMDVDAIAAALRQQQVIRSPLAFRLLARQEHVGRLLEAGTYQVGPGMSPRQILQRMAAGRVTVRKVTVPEGWDAAEVVAVVRAAGLSAATGMGQALSDTALLRAAGLPQPAPGVQIPLEGYLFPATYAFPPGVTAAQVAQAMVARFNQAWTAQLRTQAAAQGLDTAQAVTLASIVQREVATPTDMRIVAGIYLRRLKAGRHLDADPTVLYAVGSATQSGPLTAAELGVNSPYNTYVHRGLPPGPICNPGLAALQAVADPTSGQAMYFLTTPSGRLVVADTLAQQTANAQKYLGQ